MTWTGTEIEHLHDAVEASGSAPSNSVEDEVEVDGDGDEEMEDGEDEVVPEHVAEQVTEQPAAKKIRIVGSYAQSREAGGSVQQVSGNGIQQQNPLGDGTGNGQVYAQGQASAGDVRVPFFKRNLAEPDDKGDNDCFFDTCATKAGGTSYLMKHLRDKHGLVRGDQGRLEGGKRKAPKYLTLCPTNWPFKHNASSSCQACEDIAGVMTVLGQRDHESPAICSFCWTYLPTRRDLVAHVDQGPCKSNEGFPQKVAYVRHLYAETLCIPGAEEISRAASSQRQAHAEAERAARSEKWQAEQQVMQAWAEQYQRQQQEQLQPVPPPYAHPEAAPSGNSEAQQTPQRSQRRNRAPAQAAAAATPTQPPPPIPHPPHAAHPPQPYPPPTGPPADYPIPSTTAEAMARSIERLSTAVAELTAANTRLVQDMRVKDGQLAAREEMLRKKEDRVKALSLENERLSNEVGRLGLEVERLRGGVGTGTGGGGSSGGT